MASQILQPVSNSQYESFHSIRTMSFSESHLPEPLVTDIRRPSAVSSASSSPSVTNDGRMSHTLGTPQQTMFNFSAQGNPETSKETQDPPVHSGHPNPQLTSNKFSAPVPEDDELETDNQFTVTSLSGKPLLAAAAARLAKRNRRKKSNKKDKKDEKAQIEALRQRFVPPDGGYGWFIAFAAFLVQFWIAGLIKSYGVIYMEVLQIFPEASASVASWIPAILSTICLVFSPICSALCQRFSCRLVVFIGGLLCWLGISLSFFASSPGQLCFTFGVLTGLGAGLSTTPGIIMTSRYFDKHRALANGICVSGTAAGSMVIPPLMEYLVPMYGFRGSILILGACMLHVCFSAVIYRPMEVHQRIIELSQQKKTAHVDWDDLDLSVKDSVNSSVATENAVSVTHNTLQVPGLSGIPEDSVSSNCDVSSLNEQRTPRSTRRFRTSSILHSIEDLSTDSTCYYKDTKSIRGSSITSLGHLPVANGSVEDKPVETPAKSSCCCSVNLSRYIDLSLTGNPVFLLFTSTVMLMAVGCPHVLFYLPDYAYSAGLSKNDCSLLLSISAILDLLGRLGFGWIADLHIFSSTRAYSVSILLSGISVLFLPFTTSFTGFAVIVSCYGLGLGCWFLLIPVLLRKHHGTEAIGSSYALARLFQGMVTLVIPPFIGFIKDTSGDYVIGFYFMGACMILGGIVINFVPCVQRYLIQRDAAKRANNF